MTHFQSNPAPEDKAIAGHVGACMLAAMRSFKRRYFDLPQMYVTLYNDPTLTPEQTAQLADEWAEAEFRKELQA